MSNVWSNGFQNATQTWFAQCSATLVRRWAAVGVQGIGADFTQFAPKWSTATHCPNDLRSSKPAFAAYSLKIVLRPAVFLVVSDCTGF
jgi:hypothetical protein